MKYNENKNEKRLLSVGNTWWRWWRRCRSLHKRIIITRTQPNNKCIYCILKHSIVSSRKPAQTPNTHKVMRCERVSPARRWKHRQFQLAHSARTADDDLFEVAATSAEIRDHKLQFVTIHVWQCSAAHLALPRHSKHSYMWVDNIKVPELDLKGGRNECSVWKEGYARM